MEETKTKAMSTSEIVSEIAEHTQLEKKAVKQVLEKLSSLARREAINGFKIDGIGKLVLVDRPARTGRNPRTGETVQIPAKKAIKFKVSKDCKVAILGN